MEWYGVMLTVNFTKIYNTLENYKPYLVKVGIKIDFVDHVSQTSKGINDEIQNLKMIIIEGSNDIV